MIRVSLGDGRFVNVDTDDPAQAAAAAKKYLASGTMQPQAAQAGQSTLGDIGTGLVAGGANALTGMAGFGGDIRSAIGSGVRFLSDKFGVPPEDAERAASLIETALRGVPLLGGMTSEKARAALEKVTGPIPQPQSTAGEFARTIAEFSPAALLPGSAGARIAQSVLPAVASETAGQLTEGTSIEGPARMAGAVAGGVSPAVAARIASPLPASRAVRAATANLKKEGVTAVTAGQATGSKIARAMEGELGGNATQEILEKGGRQFTAAVLKRVGIGRKRALGIETRDDLTNIVDSAFSQNGSRFDVLTRTADLPVTPNLRGNVAQALLDYRNNVSDAFKIRRVEEIAGKLLQRNNASSLRLTGKQYQSDRSALGKAAQSLRRNQPEAAQAVRDMQSALDNAMEAHLRSTAPDAAGEFAKVRREYRDLLIVERAVTSAGQDAASGVINPRQLRSAAQQIMGRRVTSRGKNDLEKLARDGELVMSDVPNSGTPIRLRAQNLGLNLLTGTGGGLAGGVSGDPTAAAIGFGLGAAGPFALGRALVSSPGRTFLSNQAATGFRSRMTSPAISGLVAGGSANQ